MIKRRTSSRDSGAIPPQLASSPPAVAPSSDLPGTILSIQILRFVAALSVVVFHSHHALVGRIAGRVPGAVDHAFYVGASGVHVFFVISGFVMVYTTFRSGLTPGTFLSRRLIRIYPIYWLVAACYLVAHYWLGTGYQLSPLQHAGALLLLPGDSSLIIGPGWTLSFEMYFYLCFALSLFLGLTRGLILLSVLYIFAIAGGLLLTQTGAFAGLITNSLLLEFIAGAGLGYAFGRGVRFGTRMGGVLVTGGLSLFVSGFWLPYERLPSIISWGIPALLLVSGALAFEMHLRTPLGHRLAKLGDSSYLLYLLHVLVLDLILATPVAAINRDDQSAILLSLPLAVVCTIVAALGYQIIELPLLKLMKRAVLRHRKPPAALRV